MKILVLNGPNINMLGIREPNIYGKSNYQDLCEMIEMYCQKNNIDVLVKQSNYEGDLVSWIQDAYFDKFDGIVINPGAYTHTSIALLDALKSVSIRTIEVHISNTKNRESFRQISYVGLFAEKTIMGMGLNGYIEAIKYLTDK